MANENEPKNICCCGAVSWAKVIGSIQIITYIFGVIGGCMLLAAAAAPLSDELKEKLAASGTDASTARAILLGMAVGGLLFSIIGIVTGVLLIKGAQLGNTAYLTTWVVFAAICYIWNVAETATSAEHVAFFIAYLIFLTVIYGFGFYIVHVLKKEIREGIGANGVVHNTKA